MTAESELSRAPFHAQMLLELPTIFFLRKKKEFFFFYFFWVKSTIITGRRRWLQIPQNKAHTESETYTYSALLFACVPYKNATGSAIFSLGLNEPPIERELRLEKCKARRPVSFRRIIESKFSLATAQGVSKKERERERKSTKRKKRIAVGQSEVL